MQQKIYMYVNYNLNEVLIFNNFLMLQLFPLHLNQKVTNPEGRILFSCQLNRSCRSKIVFRAENPPRILEGLPPANKSGTVELARKLRRTMLVHLTPSEKLDESLGQIRYLSCNLPPLVSLLDHVPNITSKAKLLFKESEKLQ